MSDSGRSTSDARVSRKTAIGESVSPPVASAKLTGSMAATSDPILALYEEWQRAQASVTQLCQGCQELEKYLMEQAPACLAGGYVEGSRSGPTFKQAGPLDLGDGLHASLNRCQSLSRPGHVSDIPASGTLDALERLWAEEASAWAKLQNAADEIFRTQAQSLMGVAIKVRLILSMCTTGPEDAEFPIPQLRATLADVERLCG